MSDARRAATAETTARMLLEVEALRFRPEEPFRFTSGWASPVYVDCRKLIAYPRVRRALMAFAEETILREVGYERLDMVAGGETAGIPFAAWIAERLGLPMAYVRKQPKGFGRNAQIEGEVREGERALLVEDLATDGRSKIRFVEAMRAAGLRVEHAFVLFSYGVYPETEGLLRDAGLRLHALATWADVLPVARAEGYLPGDGLRVVEAFLADPAAWSAAHGGAGA